MGVLTINLEDFGEVSRRYPPLIEWNRHSRMQTGSGHVLRVSGVDYAGTGIYDQGWYDSNYELVDPLPSGASKYTYYLFFRGLGLTYRPSLAGVSMKITWTKGAGVTGLTFGGDANNNVSVNLAGRSATFTWGATGTAPQGGNDTQNSWVDFNLTSGGEPPQNIKVFEAANETALNAGWIFDPTWLAQVSQFNVVRLLNPMQANSSPAITTDDWPTTSFCFWSGSTNKNNGRKVGIPMSIIAALANASGRPIWITIPHQFTDAAIRTLAEYLRDHCSTLVFVEWSNETWNAAFGQYTYCLSEGSTYWAGNGSRGFRYAGLRAAQVMSIFRDVYGSDSGDGEWTGILGGVQNANPGDLTQRLVGVDYFLNPSNAMLRTGDTVATLFTHVATAAYFSVVPTTTGSEPGATLATWSDLNNQETFNQNLYDKLKYAAGIESGWFSVARLRQDWQSIMTTAGGRGLTVAMYEGGNHCLCALPLQDNNSGETYGIALNLNFARFATSEQCAKLYGEIYRLWKEDGGVLPCKYLLVGQHTKYGPWGMYQDVGLASDVSGTLEAVNAGRHRIRLSTS